MLSVVQTVIDKGIVKDSYARELETLDDALVYYDDIDLRQEFSIEVLCSPQGTCEKMTMSKQLFDSEGTLDRCDYYDWDMYKGGE